MADFQIRTPVAFIIFNRPGPTKSVFDEIRRSRPPKLLVIADGPREGHPGDAAKCHAAREIIETVDWPCEVIKNYSDVNLGCGARLASGITWLFDQVDEAIILEDDCLPHMNFFRFCELLLEKYRTDERIMHISGNNCQIAGTTPNDSYYFSRYPHCWGWATWRRAWAHYDFSLSTFSEIQRKNCLEKLLLPKARRYWTDLFSELHGSKIPFTWDYQWTYACLINSGLCVAPNSTLVSNIGFGPEATHTKDSGNWLANLATQGIAFPLRHPLEIKQDRIADAMTENKVFRIGFMNDFLWRIKRTLRGNLK